MFTLFYTKFRYKIVKASKVTSTLSKNVGLPSNSPANENLWQILKRRVEKQANKVLILKKPVTAESFREIIKKEWEGIDKKIFVNLIHSMPSRLNEVIEENGNKISY
ncbi:16544_t:CDS:1 [Entrophospora sp. SA101]|nr:16544_t:CDS:1 [Entrophospora sp. SA101]